MTRLSAILSLLSILLVGCGMSEEERQNIAAVTCSIIGETRNFESARRVALVNESRSRLGEPPFLDGDDLIKLSVEYGGCPELVLNSPDYFQNIIELMQQQKEVERLVENRKRQLEFDRQHSEIMRAREQEREKRESAENQRKLDHDKFRDLIQSRDGKLLLDCTWASLLIDLERNLIRVSQNDEGLSLSVSIRDNKYSKMQIRDVSKFKVEFSRIEKDSDSRDVEVIDKITLPISPYASGHFDYTKVSANGDKVWGGYCSLTVEKVSQ